MSVLHKLSGGPELLAWFGYEPKFHDSEVISIELRRNPEPSVIKIHAWNANEDVDEDGYFKRDRHATVEFIFSGISHLEISGWNHQNVLENLEVTEGADGYVFALNATFGVDGQIVAKELSITIEPGPPSR